MKTISFESIREKKDYERPPIEEDVIIHHIEEINVSDSIDGKRLALPIDRGYKLYWENEKGELKFWACVLGSHTYKKHVLPNFSDVPTEGNE